MAVVLLSVSTALGLLAAEWIAGVLSRSPWEAAAAKAGTPWDGRNRLDVVLEARATEANWYPAVPANTYLEQSLLIEGRHIIPLGGVADANVVGCNENGYFSTFKTDEFGFNNPRGLLAAEGAKLFVGDSFTQGDCLRHGETIVDRVRAQRPNTVNLATGGNGPLLKLAAIREYVRQDDAAVVVWMYYEGNDLNDLLRDAANPLLRQYLDARFSQNLIENQDSINSAVRSLVDARLAERLRDRPRVLPRLRELLWQVRQRHAPAFAGSAIEERAGTIGAEALELFRRVLATAQSNLTAKGGRLVFVYLPEFRRYAGVPLSAGARRRDDVLAIARQLGLDVIDLDEAFRAHGNAAMLFPFGVGGHYNADGAAVVATALLTALPR